MAASQATELFDVVGEGAPIGLAYIDPDLRYVRVNAALAALNRRPVDEHLGRRVAEVVPELADQVLPILRQVLETGEPVVERELSGEGPDGRVRHVVASDFPLRPGGTRAGVGAVVVDVTARRAAAMRL